MKIRILHPTQPGMSMVGFGGTISWAKTDPSDARQVFEMQEVKDAPAAPAPAPAPVPVPAPPAPTDPKTHPAEVKSGAVPLGPVSTTKSNSYPSAVSGPYRAVNNTWGASGLTGKQAVGIQPGAVGVDVRIMWQWPATGREVISYPEVAYGRSASFPKEASAKLPMPAKDLTKLTTSYGNIDGGAAGNGHVTYDLWTSTTPNALSRDTRRAEIMLPEMPFGGYGVPNSGAPAAGREGQNGSGRNPHGYVERATFGGEKFDVFYFPAGSKYTGLGWQFIVFEPLVFGGSAGKARDWMPMIAYMRAKGWIKDSDYMNSIELGVEPVGNGYASGGDLILRNVVFEVQ